MHRRVVESRHTCTQWPRVHEREWYHLEVSKHNHFLCTRRDRKAHFSQKECHHEIKGAYLGEQELDQRKEIGGEKGINVCTGWFCVST